MPDIRIMLMIAAVALSALAGWATRGWKEDAARLAAERAAVKQLQEVAGRYGQALNNANDALAKDHLQASADRHDFNRRLRDARKHGTKLVGCDARLDAGRPTDFGIRVHFDPVFVRLWDDGLAVGLPAAYRTASPDRSGTGADLLDPEDLLENVAENGEQCNEMRSRLLVAKQWAVEIGAAK